MARKVFKTKKTISIKRFISELGESFTENMKKRLLELEVRCVLTRKEDNYKLDLKHVEHLKYDFSSDEGVSKRKKEYVYGQFIVVEGVLYFAEKCNLNNDTAQSPIVDTIYNSLDSEITFIDDSINAKIVDDSNIDFIVDNILKECPNVSEKYTKIVKEMISLAERQ